MLVRTTRAAVFGLEDFFVFRSVRLWLGVGSPPPPPLPPSPMGGGSSPALMFVRTTRDADFGFEAFVFRSVRVWFVVGSTPPPGPALMLVRTTSAAGFGFEDFFFMGWPFGSWTNSLASLLALRHPVARGLPFRGGVVATRRNPRRAASGNSNRLTTPCSGNSATKACAAPRGMNTTRTVLIDLCKAANDLRSGRDPAKPYICSGQPAPFR